MRRNFKSLAIASSASARSGISNRLVLCLLLCAAPVAARAEPQSKRTSPRQASNTTKPAKETGYVGYTFTENGYAKVIPGSPAARAGMIDGDWIVAIDSTPVNLSHSKRTLDMLRGTIGSPVTITFMREGKTYRCRVIRARIDRPAKLSNSRPPAPMPSRGFYREAGKTRQAGSSSAPSPDEALVSAVALTPDTPAMHAAVLRVLTHVGPSAKQELLQAGVKIVITPTLKGPLANSGDVMSCWELTHLAFYSTSANTIFVPEERIGEDGKPEPNLHMTAALLHQIGHALDNSTQYSKTSAFLSNYQMDITHLSNTQRTKYHYFTRDSAESRRELFAELFAIATCPPSQIPAESAGLEQIFPVCFSLAGDLAK